MTCFHGTNATLLSSDGRLECGTLTQWGVTFNGSFCADLDLPVSETETFMVGAPLDISNKETIKRRPTWLSWVLLGWLAYWVGLFLM